MKEALLTLLRDQSIDEKQFRKAADQLCELLAADAAKSAKKESVVLVPILRSGLVLLPPFLRHFEEARVGFFGMRRDHETFKPILYYENIPPLDKKDKIFLLDPMLATGGSTLLAIQNLVQKGADTSRITLISLIAAPEGLTAVQKAFPQVKISTVAVDEKLNARKFIVPGLGDFGDRYFGTINNQSDIG